MAGEFDEFELFRARALGGGIAPHTRQVQSLPSTPPGTPDRIREEDDEDDDSLQSPSGSIGSGHHHHHQHHRYRGRREAGPGAVPTQLSQDSTEGSLHDVSAKESRHVLRMPSVTVDPPTPCEERLPSLDVMNTSLPKLDSGLQRSHSCRVRRSPRPDNHHRKAFDDHSHHGSHQRLLDREPNDQPQQQQQPAFNRQRNRTMPVKRNRSPRRSSQTLEPFGMESISPSDLESGECRIYRVRSFTTHGSGVVNRGDSFKIKSRSPRGGSLRHQKSPSRCSMLNQSAETGIDKQENVGCNGSSSICIPAIAIDSVSLNAEGATGGEDLEQNGGNGEEEGALEEGEGGDEEEGGEEEEAYINRVLVLGSQGVGKSTLTQQLMTSEYLANKESGPDDETGEHIVSVMLDDIESMVLFLDTRGAEPVKDRDDVDAFLVVYSVTDRNSFSYAQACLQDICGKGKGSKKAVILVANKQESVRNRAVSEDDGRNLATKRRCKFLEVSALLDHKVDELLVGIIRQIRIKQAMAQKSSDNDAKLSPTGCLHKAAFGLFRKLFRRSQPGIARSCDNLLV